MHFVFIVVISFVSINLEANLARQIKSEILYVSKSYYFDACDILLWEIKKLMSSNSLKFDSLVAIAKGGLIVGTYLASKLDLPLLVVYASSYEGTKQGEVLVAVPSDWNFRTMKILLVDDLYDTGETLRAVVKELEWRGGDVVPLVLFRKKKVTEFPLVDKFAGYTKSWIQFFYEKEIL